MSIVPIYLFLSLLFLISIIGIGVYVQVQLSKSENKFLGLILPILSVLLSLSIVFGMTMFTSFTSISIDGAVQSSEQIVVGADYLSIIFLLVITNIPTFLFGAIYYSERNRMKLRKTIEELRKEDESF